MTSRSTVVLFAVSTVLALLVGSMVVTTLLNPYRQSVYTTNPTTSFPRTPVENSSKPATEGGTGYSSTASCVITGAPVGAELRILTDSGSLTEGARVSGSSGAYCNGQLQVITLHVVTTNLSGWADLEPVYGNYNLTVAYSGHTYNLSLPNRPMSATYATFYIPSGRLTTSFCFGGRHCSTGSTGSQAFPTVYTVNATFVSRFCSNSSDIPRSITGSGGGQAASLQPSGSEGPIGFSVVSSGWKNTGSSPVSVEAICIDAVGMVPAVVTNVGPTATILQLAISPSGPIQPGQEANISASFTGGSGMYYMPQGGLGITVIAADGSSVSEGAPVGGGFLTTARSATPLVSVRSASLLAGNIPVLSALLSFNSTVSPISEVDVYVNGTYIGTAGVGHNATSPNAPNQYEVSYNIRIMEPERISIVDGARYAIMFVAATRGFTETSVSTGVVAGA